MQPCRLSSPKINASRTPGLLRRISALALPMSLAQRERSLPLCWRWWAAFVPPVILPLMCTLGSKIPLCGALPRGEGGGDSHGAGGFIAGGSRRCLWRYFILASCLGCFSFLLRRAVAGLGDAGIPQPAGCVVAVPGTGGSPPSHPGPGVLIEPAGTILPALGIPGVPGGGEREPGCLWMGSGGWDGVWWRQTCFPLNPPRDRRREAPFSPSPWGLGGPGGCRAAFPHH